MDKTYNVIFKNRKPQDVTGTVVLFSNTNTDLPIVRNAVYLNVDEVISITEVSGKE